jgi:hypothetical protein
MLAGKAMKIRRHIWTLIVLLALVVACGRGADKKPSVKILSPSDQDSIILGETLQVESRARDDGGLDRIELRINGLQVYTTQVTGAEKSFRAVQRWRLPEAGTYFVTVIAYDSAGQASEPAGLTIAVRPAPSAVISPSPTASAMPLPTPLPSGPGSSSCTYDATFVTDVTIPDNTQLAPGTEFVKTWRLHNSGSCDWGAGFQFVFIAGEQMGDLAMVNVSPTAAGNTVDVSVPFKAPQSPGTYRSRWRMRTPDGQDFGERPFVQIVVPPPATATPAPAPTATSPPRPDLTLTLDGEYLELLVGQPLALRVTVHNHGPGSMDRPAVVQAVLRNDLKIESGVTALPAGGQEANILAHTFDVPSELEALIVVDPQNEIAEVDETNNSARITLAVNPPLYATRTLVATPGLSFDLDDAANDAQKIDAEWRVVEGTIYLELRNGAGAARLSGVAESVSYALVAGLPWERERLALADLTAGALFGFRTSDGRVGYAQVSAVLDAARTSARLDYTVWNW